MFYVVRKKERFTNNRQKLIPGQAIALMESTRLISSSSLMTVKKAALLAPRRLSSRFDTGMLPPSPNPTGMT